MSVKFSTRFVNQRGRTMLNICDAKLLGSSVENNGHAINISKGQYGEKIIGEGEAKELLIQSAIINMVGKETISLAVDLGMGSHQGAKTIGGVPFLMIYKL